MGQGWLLDLEMEDGWESRERRRMYYVDVIDGELGCLKVQSTISDNLT
jgi:hypothetical protein